MITRKDTGIVLCPQVHTLTHQFNSMLTKPFHAGHAIQLLDRGGLTLDMFRMAMGSKLITDKSGNGDVWYEWQQVWDYYVLNANVPANC